MAGADVAIVGGGLAGILLAHELEKLGASVVIADETAANAASAMAPGIINPLAGRRYKINTDYADTHAATLATFAELETRFGCRLWNPVTLVRLLENTEQRAALDERRSDRGASAWIGRIFEPGAHGAGVHDPFGSFETLQAGWLDVPLLVEAARRTGGFRFLDPADLDGETAPRLVDCRGWRCSLDPHWRELPWKCARGEVMTVELEGTLPRHLWNGGGWLQPLPDGRWRAGATYAWSQFEAPPQLTAQAELIGKLRRWMRLPFRIASQQAGVRAVVVDYRPVMGAWPESPGRFIFSGLGSHGAIQGPPGASVLARHLLLGEPLPRDCDVNRFRR